MALPSVALSVAAAVLGLGSPAGIALLVVSLVSLAVVALFLQPKIIEKKFSLSATERSSAKFLHSSTNFQEETEVARAVSQAVESVIGVQARSVLVAPRRDGSIGFLDDELEDIDLGNRDACFQWLGSGDGPLYRAAVTQAELGGKQTAELMDMVGASVLLPLRHRGDLLGLLLVADPTPMTQAGIEFYRAMNIYATTAFANASLRRQADNRSGVTKTLGLANAVQESLMPDERAIRGTDWELRGIFRPVADCGGDMWAWKELPNRKILIVVGDATGHGAGPALLSAVAKGTVDAHAEMAGADCDPALLLADLNRAVCRVGQRIFMMTAFALVADLRARTIHFANAGQNFPFVIGVEGLEALVVRGDQLGANEAATFKTHSRPIRPGEKVLIYTDGIVEAGEPVREQFGERRFRRLVQSMEPVAAAEVPQRILSTVEKYLDGEEIHDDVTMVAFEYVREGERAL